MANGQPGKKLSIEQRQQVERLIRQGGLDVEMIATRAGVSKSQVRNVIKEIQPEIDAETLAKQLWPDESIDP